MNIDKNIFREYDIRGVYPAQLNEDNMYIIGKAYGTYINNMGVSKCVIGHDNRLSSPNLSESLINGIISTGVNVIDIGLVTTPMLYYARILLNINSGIMVTASHNPKDDNGLKLSFNDIGNAKGEEIYKFRDFIYEGKFIDGNGSKDVYNIKEEYYKLIKDNLHFGNKKIKVVLDPGNGVTSIYAKELYSMFNLDVIMINDISDGTFPNHHPDPNVIENLEQLKSAVISNNADIGIAFDGDGDRVGFILNDGNILMPDEYAVIVLRDILTGNNKKALYDIKCSNIVKEEIIKLGGTYIENRTGASYMMDSVIKNNTLFGIEYSGHVYFNNGFLPITSGLYAGLKLLEIMSKTDIKSCELLGNVTKYVHTPELKFPFSDDIKRKVIDEVYKYAKDKNYDILDIDGVKVYFPDGWALIRCSNTGPNITARFEAVTKERLDEIESEFLDVLLQAKRNLEVL